ncbi:MAG: aminopeptidase, partial [Prevotella sp.]|nr:aminopeptidase [Prevotella sp.]
MNRYILTTTILLVVAINMNAQLPSFDKDEYTVIVQNPITPVKDQNRSGTCWAYASLAYFESEILRKTGRVYDLSEMFLANKDYMDCAVYHVRMHGESRFSEGGSVTDALEVARNYGLCPQSAMPIGGSLSADSLANFTEFFSLLKPYVEAVAKPKEDKENESKVDKISPQWKVGMQKILDQYLGACPE